MLLALFGFLKSPFGKTIGIALAIAVVAGILYSKGYTIGKAAGVEGQKQAVEQGIIKPTVDASKESMQAQVAAANANEQRAIGIAVQAQQGQAQATAALKVAVAALNQVKAQNAALPDSQLHAATVQALGQRDPADQTPGYTPGEERAIHEAVTVRPELEKQNAILLELVAETRKEVAAQNDRIAAIEQRQEAIVGYTNTLEKAYADLYNLHPPRKRSAKCLFLWKCADNKLAAPKPEELLAKKPK